MWLGAAQHIGSRRPLALDWREHRLRMGHLTVAHFVSGGPDYPFVPLRVADLSSAISIWAASVGFVERDAPLPCSD